MGAILTDMPNCKEVARAISADQLSSADWRSRLSIRFHIFMCRHCRRYFRQMRAIGGAVRRDASATTAESDSHDRLRDAIVRKIPPPKS